MSCHGITFATHSMLTLFLVGERPKAKYQYCNARFQGIWVGVLITSIRFCNTAMWPGHMLDYESGIALVLYLVPGTPKLSAL